MRLVCHFPVVALLLGPATQLAQSGPPQPLGTAFTYQGRIKQSDVLVNGTCDLCFKLYDVAVGGTAIAQDSHPDVQVGNGLFVVPDVDFGPGAFAGDSLWIEVSACCGNPGCNNPCLSGAVVSPRQAITATPYAAHALGPWESDSSGDLFYSGGNVGIGGPPATGVLHLWTDTPDNVHGLAWNSTTPIGSSSARAYLADDGQGDTTWYLVRAGNATKGLSISAAGDVGIGFSPSGAKLHVFGPPDDGSNNIGVLKLQDSPANKWLMFDSDDLNLVGGSVLWINGNSPANVSMAEGGGSVGIGLSTPSARLHVVGNILATGSCNCSSDARLKTNISPIGDALARLSALNGVTFEWNAEARRKLCVDSGPQVGLIGQEVAEVVPEAVLKDGEGYYYVAYGQLVPVLIEAVKELRGIAQDSESRLAEQRKLIDRQYELIQDLSGRLAALESAVESR